MKMIASMCLLLTFCLGKVTAVAQDLPPRSSSEQLDAAKAVEVEVSGRDEKGISGVSVKLTSLSRRGEVKTAITDSSGRVRFEGQPDGSYWLDISGPLVYGQGVVDVSPGQRRFGLGLREIDGKPVMQRFVYTSAPPAPPPGIICTLPCYSTLPIVEIETEMCMSVDKLALPPAPPVVSLVPPGARRRNPIARFFSALRH